MQGQKLENSIKPKLITGYLLVGLAVLSWSLSEILQKLLQDTVPPMSKSFFRFFFGIIPLIAILIGKKDFKIKALIHRNWKELLIAGIFGFGIGNFVYFLGIERTLANLGSGMYATYPLFISIYSFFLLNEKSNWKLKTIGYVIGFIAVFLILTNLDFQNLANSEYIVGNLLVLLGAAIWSVFSVLGKKITLAESELTQNIELKFNLITMILAGMTNLIMLLFMPAERATFFIYPLTSWGYLSILGVVVTGLGTWLFFYGIKNIEVSKGISLAMFKPFLSVILAYFILGEKPSILLLICLPFVAIAIILINKK